MSALNGLKIIELAENVAGEFCGKLLADFGAAIVKIEKPETGSATRHLSPFAHGVADPEASGLFAYLNTNKKSVTLDLETAPGQAKLREMLGQADVVIDDHAPGWLRSVGLDPARLETDYPNLILCAITPFGQSAPAYRAHSQDLIVFQASGWGYHTPSGSDNTRPPLKGAGRFMASYEAGLDGALCVAACAYAKLNGKKGGLIDISGQEVMASRVDYVLGQMITGDLDTDSERTRFDLGGPSGFFRAREGFVYIWMSSPEHWRGILKLLGNPEWAASFPENWLERGLTPERVATCRQHLGEYLQTQDKDAVSELCQSLGVTLVPVNDGSDLLRSPQIAFRKYFAEIEHPAIGTVKYPTVPYQLSATPQRLAAPAPLLGQHNGEAPFAGVPAPSRVPSAAQVTRHRGGPLRGVRVLELTKVWAGPYFGRQMALLGAESIRVESLGSVDVTRIYGVDDINKAPGFQSVNPQKLSIQIDMKSPEGIKLLKELLGKCDILVENLRPGAIERLGLGYQAVKAVKPDIVYVSMGMYGSEGPLSRQTGYAPCFAAIGGISNLVGYAGEVPLGMNTRYADSTFGNVAAFAALVGLNHRARTGQGQFIDVSAVETMTTMIGDVFMDYSLNGKTAACDGNRHSEMAPHNLYRCEGEDWIAIAVAADKEWQALAGVMGKPELGHDPRFASLSARKEHEEELDRMLAAWATRQDAKALAEQLQAAGVAATKSANSLDLVTDEHFWARDFYRYVTDSEGETKAVIGPAWRMTDAAELKDAAPTLGQHNAYIFGEIMGMPEDEQQRLIQAGVIR